MKKDDRIVLGTSIAPFNIETQKECILSWVRNGFKVFSFNCEAEIKVLKEAFSDIDIEFVKIKRSAVEICGKELPFIQDILNYVSDIAQEVCGYFNSDIYFDNITSALYNYISAEAKDSLIAVHRNEINTLDDIKAMNWDINLDGIDGFFLDKHRAENLYDDWAFVQSVWDSFLLILCQNNGIPVKSLLNPIAFHKRHKVRWNFERTQKTFDTVIQYYYDGKPNGRRDIFYDTYHLLYAYSKNIVYCERKDYKTLFVLEVLDEKVEASIAKQGLTDYRIVTDEREAGQEWDFVFRIKKGVVLDAAFSAFAFHLFETYGTREVEMGRFFISEVEDRVIYNQLNKNITQLAEINQRCDLFSLAIANKTQNVGKGTVLYPVCYEQIDLTNQNIVDKIKVDGPTYIMPAGYRSGEWYAVNRCNLKSMNIVGCLDNDQSKAGSQLYDKKIYEAKEVLKKKGKYNLILCTKYYQEEIRKQVANNDFVQFVDADMVLWVDKEGEMYVFNLEHYCQNS